MIHTAQSAESIFFFIQLLNANIQFMLYMVIQTLQTAVRFIQMNCCYLALAAGKDVTCDHYMPPIEELICTNSTF